MRVQTNEYDLSAIMHPNNYTLHRLQGRQISKLRELSTYLTNFRQIIHSKPIVNLLVPSPYVINSCAPASVSTISAISELGVPKSLLVDFSVNETFNFSKVRVFSLNHIHIWQLACVVTKEIGFVTTTPESWNHSWTKQSSVMAKHEEPQITALFRFCYMPY